MKSIPLSVRISEDDAAFLARVELGDAKTPSDKIRAIISETRRRMDGVEDFSDCAELLRDMMSPAFRKVREGNKELGLRSDFIERLGEWLPESLAYFIAGLPDEKMTKASLEEFEGVLADRICALLEFFLRLGVTQESPCYDPALVASRLKTILELADIAKKHQPQLSTPQQ